MQGGVIETSQQLNGRRSREPNTTKHESGLQVIASGHLYCGDVARGEEAGEEQQNAGAVQGVGTQAGEDTAHHRLHLLHLHLQQQIDVVFRKCKAAWRGREE